MNVKADLVDRSRSTPCPSISLNLLVSFSITSLGGWILLGNTAYGYSQLTEEGQEPKNSDSVYVRSNQHQEAQDSITPEFSDSVSFTESVNSANDQLSWHVAFPIVGSDLVADGLTLASEPAAPTEAVDRSAAAIDWVEEFDRAAHEASADSSYETFQEPFIEIAEPIKSIQPETPVPLSSSALEQTDGLIADPRDTEENLEPAGSAVDLETADLETADRPQADALGEPLVTVQGVYLLEGDDSSARARLSASCAITPNVLVGTTLDLTTGDAFTDSPEAGFDLNELFVTVSAPTLPSLRLTLGMIDLTSYFDRNSFAKDAATHFFNPVFQTNPALAAAGIGSRPGVLVNWDLTDNLSLRGAAFSSDRDLDEFAFDGAAAEVALRLGHLIVRGTYVTDRDAGQDSGFNEIFQFRRGDDDFGLQSDDRETAYGLNAEYFIPAINLGLFARYGRYENQALDRGGNTHSLGVNVLDLFFADDRLGLGYGRELSNNSLRRDRDDEIPDVLELFYDVRLARHFRAGVTLQGRDAFSETVAGLRLRADFNLSDLWR